MEITCGSCHNIHGSVEEVKQCHDAKEHGVTPSISEPQRALINSLLKERVAPVDLTDAPIEDVIDMLTHQQASELITRMYGWPRKPREESSSPISVTPGAYKMDGVIYKVKRAQAGHLYAQRLDGTASWSLARGAIFKLQPEHRLSLEDATEWGRQTGCCIMCSRTLTDPVSIANGIGPICAGAGQWSDEERARVLVGVQTALDLVGGS